MEQLKSPRTRLSGRPTAAPRGRPDRRGRLPDVGAIRAIAEFQAPAEPGEPIYRQSAPARAVYLVGVGSVKTCRKDARGVEHVTGLYLPGELFGLASLARDVYPSSAVPLETTALWVLPLARLNDLLSTSSGGTREFMRLVSRAMRRCGAMGHLRDSKAAEQRVAGFLLRVSQRLTEAGYSGTEFRLSLSRREIASYLGLSVGTVCRTLQHFQDEGLIRIRNRRVTLRDAETLQRIPEAA